MLTGKIAGLMVVEALQRSTAIEANIPAREVVGALKDGRIVVIKNAFDPDALLRLRALIVSANLPFREPGFHEAESWRNRREVYAGGVLDILYDTSFLAVAKSSDKVGRAARETAERLAALWRAMTGEPHTFTALPERRALRCWAMQYPVGGGCFNWHRHRAEPTKIGIILALSRTGVDFDAGGTEFETPFGVVDATPHHDLGDICLFRYDLPHRVAAVDPDEERRWDDSGRWTFLIQGDPRPPEQVAS